MASFSSTSGGRPGSFPASSSALSCVEPGCSVVLQALAGLVRGEVRGAGVGAGQVERHVVLLESEGTSVQASAGKPYGVRPYGG